MIFGLGALVSGAVAFALAPGLWRRAVRVTRERIRTTIWTDQASLRAQADALAAAHGMRVRRLERAIEMLQRQRRKQAIALALARQDTAQLRAVEKRQAQTISALEHVKAELKHDIVRLDKARADTHRKLQTRGQALANAQALLGERDERIEALGDEVNMYQRRIDEMTIERVSQQTRNHVLESDVRRLNGLLQENARKETGHVHRTHPQHVRIAPPAAQTDAAATAAGHQAGGRAIKDNVHETAEATQRRVNTLTEALRKETRLRKTLAAEMSARNYTLEVQRSHIAKLKRDLDARDAQIATLNGQGESAEHESDIVAELKMRNETLLHKLSSLEAQMSALLANAVKARQIESLPDDDIISGQNVTRLSPPDDTMPNIHRISSNGALPGAGVATHKRQNLDRTVGPALIKRGAQGKKPRTEKKRKHRS